MPNLPHAKVGADAFQTYLRTNRKVPSVSILRRDDSRFTDLTALLGPPGDRGAALRKAFSGAVPGELNIYIAGHLGVNTDGAVMLMPADGDPEAPAQTGYLLSTLYQNVAALRTPRLRVYLDGAVLMDSASPAGKIKLFPSIGPAGTNTPPGWVVMAATTGNQPNAAPSDTAPSLFTSALIAGLTGNADESADGLIKAGELFAYVRQVLAAAGSAAESQVPAFYGRSGQLLAQVTARSNLPKPNPLRKTDGSKPEALTEPAQDAATGPGFDCSRAKIRAEKTVCRNAELAALDLQMTQKYVQLRRRLKGSRRRALIRRQAAWRKERNTCRSNVTCLNWIYKERIGQLK